MLFNAEDDSRPALGYAVQEQVVKVLKHEKRVERDGEVFCVTANSDTRWVMEWRLAKLFELCRKDVQADGSCFFRAVSDQLFSTESYHMDLRILTVNWLEEHCEQYKYFIDTSSCKHFQDYVDNMRKTWQWVDHVTIQALADCLDIVLVIVESSPVFKPVTVIRSSRLHPHSEEVDRNDHDSRFIHNVDFYIVLGHIGENHYVSTRKQDDM